MPASGPVIMRSSPSSRVDQRRFADIRPSDDGDTQRMWRRRLHRIFIRDVVGLGNVGAVARAARLLDDLGDLADAEPCSAEIGSGSPRPSE